MKTRRQVPWASAEAKKLFQDVKNGAYHVGDVRYVGFDEIVTDTQKCVTSKQLVAAKVEGTLYAYHDGTYRVMQKHAQVKGPIRRLLLCLMPDKWTPVPKVSSAVVQVGRVAPKLRR